MIDDERAEQVRRATERLAFLDAIVAAQDRHEEVLALVAAAPDRSAAIAGIADLLGIEQVAARAVDDLSWQSLTVDARRRYRAERDELLTLLGEVHPG